MRSFTFVVNPEAGAGRSRRFLGEMKRLLEGVPHTLELTTAPGDATRLAAAADSDVVVAVGGDGTINEVANGLRDGAFLGIVPTGSGNDLVKSLPIPSKPLEALWTAVHGKPRLIDVGQVVCSRISDQGKEDERLPARLFLNGVGVGFDAEVAVRKERIKFLSGTPVYVAAVLQTLGHYRSPLFEVKADGFARSSRHLLIAVGNGRCAGGGFYLTPAADPSDGQLDICLIEDVSVFTILRLMPRVMRGGHIGHPSVSLIRSTKAELRSVSPFYAHADGEIVGNLVNKVEISLRAQPLAVLAG